MTVENLHDAIGQLPSDLIAKVDEKRCRKPKVIPFKRYAAMAASLALVICGGYLCMRMLYLNLVTGGSKETAAEAPAAVMQAPEEANGFGRLTEESAAGDAAPKEPESMTGSSTTYAPEEAPAEDAACEYPAIETYAAEEIPPEGVTEEICEGYPQFPAEDVQYADTRNTGTACWTSEPVLRVLRSRPELDALRENFGYCDLEAFDDCCAIYDEAWFENHDLLVVLVKDLSKNGTFSLASVTESDGSWCVRFYSRGSDTGERTDRFVFAALEKGMIPEGSRLFAMFEVP